MMHEDRLLSLRQSSVRGRLFREHERLSGVSNAALPGGGDVERCAGEMAEEFGNRDFDAGERAVQIGVGRSCQLTAEGDVDGFAGVETGAGDLDDGVGGP